MKVAFGADDQNECTTAVLDYLSNIAELEVFDDGDKWPEFAQHVDGQSRKVMRTMAW